VLHVLAVLTLSLFETTARGDTVAAEATEARAPSFPLYDGFERVLTGTLAAAAVGFQVRCKYSVQGSASPRRPTLRHRSRHRCRADRFVL
jgi:hypothetical protein